MSAVALLRGVLPVTASASLATAEDLVVRADGWLRWRGRRFACAVGRSGMKLAKREGDGATPEGRFPLRQVLYRPDRLPRPRAALPIRPLDPLDGWCAEPAHADYNRAVRQPFAAKSELLWRQDRVYDLIVPLGYNDDPVVPGWGSAIFLHVARPDFAPTAGCVALALTDLLVVLAEASPAACLTVHGRG
ncbi:MAG: hypothetical protein EXQ96_08085 [Alphaproteobacteria bacterium]|nr:hypothetical protein [Alphaproteobacteria bacterium]